MPKNVSVMLTPRKAKYYRAANAILGKLGNANNPCVTVHLMGSIALPILTYSIEAISLGNAQIGKLVIHGREHSSNYF